MSTKPIRLQPFPYQGSKRILAPIIFAQTKKKYKRIIEPFAGSSAVIVYSAHEGIGNNYWINDSYMPLAKLWECILGDVDKLADEYESLWLEQQDSPVEYYFKIRSEFNISPTCASLLFLLSKCAKNAVRFNSKGEFNQSPDKRRLGRRPAEMRRQLLATNNLLTNRTVVTSLDYDEVFAKATSDDLVYLDPPYQGTSTGKNPRYSSGLSREQLIESLKSLRDRKVPFILSYDGYLGEKEYGALLPKELGLKHQHIKVGRSAQATLNGKVEHTVESLYLSPDVI
jgi:DNA adenine methylase